LGDPEFLKLLAAIESRGLIVQIALSIEDERVQHPLVRVPNVDAAPLTDALEKFPKVKLVLLNWFRCVKADETRKLAKSKQVWFDIAMVEGVGGIANLLRDVPAEQILFGSHAPFFYLESALLKLKESPLTKNVSAAIKQENAARLLQ
jgi:predicted TIM-barrel fold metal-dependent hydrolase